MLDLKAARFNIELLKAKLIHGQTARVISNNLGISQGSVKDRVHALIFSYSVNTGKPAFYCDYCTDKQLFHLLDYYRNVISEIHRSVVNDHREYEVATFCRVSSVDLGELSSALKLIGENK